MLSRFGNKKKRIALINAEGLSMFAMDEDRLMHIAKFSHEDIGYENFRNYLSDSPHTPLTLLVDSVAEDFIAETVPHVSAYDRKSYLKRKADQHFRGVEYRSAQIIGREPTGRKNDRVLFSALTKNQIIDPWVRAALRAEVPIKSITTPAFALCKIAKDYELMTNDAILLANWEQSGIRQTFIINDKMMFSRLTPLPANPDEDLAQFILESCNQSKDYLERIGLLQFDKSLDVHVITPQLQDDAFAQISDGRNFRNIYHHNSIDMMKIEHYGGPQSTITAVLLCLDWGIRSGELKNLYAPSAALRFFHLGEARRYLTLASLLILLASALVSAPLMVDALERRNRVAQLRADIIPIQTQYNALTAQFPETPIPSEAMELAVRNYDLLAFQVSSPTELFTTISHVVAQYPAVQLSSLEWQLAIDDPDLSVTQSLLNNDSVVNVALRGTLMGSSSIGSSDFQLRQFIDALSSIPGVAVTPFSLPIETGPEGAVSTVINDDVVNAEFGLNVRLNP